MISGDNELAALDYAKHYRAPIVHLLDSDCAVQQRYHGQVSWPFLMLTDASGRIIWRHHGTLADAIPSLEAAIERTLVHVTPPSLLQRNGLHYPHAVLARSGELERAKQLERFPSVACGSDDLRYVVFTRTGETSDDVILRVYRGDRPPTDYPLAATDADEYDGTAIAGAAGRIWAAWVSNTDGRGYNVYVTSFTDPDAPSKPVRLTDHNDDAMHPRLACDRNGDVWVTYYKWHHLGSAGSRDKEVYVRRFDGAAWSDEIRVSPADVPAYEDHTEPALAPYGDGVVIAWNWDFHPPKGYTGAARTPTIFVRTVDSQLRLGPCRNVSGGSIDLTPTLAVDEGGVPWCAWDSFSLRGAHARSVCLRAWEPTADTTTEPAAEAPPTMICSGETCVLLPPGARAPVSEPVQCASRICTPTLATSPSGALTLVWAESDATGRWSLKRTDLRPGGDAWSPPQLLDVDGDPRYPSIACDREGRLWVAAAVSSASGREVVLRRPDR